MLSTFVFGASAPRMFARERWGPQERARPGALSPPYDLWQHSCVDYTAVRLFCFGQSLIGVLNFRRTVTGFYGGGYVRLGAAWIRSDMRGRKKNNCIGWKNVSSFDFQSSQRAEGFRGRLCVTVTDPLQVEGVKCGARSPDT